MEPLWTDIAQVGLIAGQLLVLAAAAVFALRQAREARQLREQQIRPVVVVDFDVGRSVFWFLSVSNTGTALARDVKIVLDSPLRSSLDTADETLAKLKMLRDSIPSLAPGKSIRTLFDSAIARKPELGLPDTYTGTVTYTDATGKRRFSEPVTLDLGIYWGLQELSEHGVHDIHERLEEIGKEVKSWSSRTGRGVVTVTPAEERARFDAFRERRRRPRWARLLDRIPDFARRDSPLR
jgi:hypothetical protein